MVNQIPKNKQKNRYSRYVGESVFFAVFSGLLLLVSCNSTSDDIGTITGVDQALVKDTPSYADALSFSPSTYSFDPLAAGLGSADKVIVITNTLSQDVYVSSISGAKAPFSIATTDCPAPNAALQSGKSCTAKVTFAPTEEGKFSMVLRVDFGIAANGSELSASTGLTGTGSSSAAVGNAALSFSPTSNDFGAVRAGSGTATKDIEVTNAATLPIYISAITKTNLNYSIPTDACPRTPTALSPGAKCMITTRFAPLAGGESSTNVKVTYGLLAGEKSFSATVNLVGTGVGALDFPGVETANPITTTTASLNWTHVTGAQLYFVYSLSGAGVSTLVANVTPPTATYNLTGLTASTSYTYFVKAVDQLGTQDTNSATVAFTTKTIGSFASISNTSVAEAATGLTAALNCSDSYGNTPTYSIASQSDSDGTCTLSAAPIKVSCTPAYKTGHSAWTSAVAVQCAINGATLTQSFTLTATDTNRAPVLTAISDESVQAGAAISSVNAYDTTANNDFDVDLDALAYTCTFSGGGNSAGTNCTSLPGTPAMNASTGVLTWTTSYGAAVSASNTTYTITITGNDQQGTPLTNAKSFAVTVTPATPLLTANADQVFPSNYLTEGSTLSLDWNNIRAGSPGNDTGMTYACVYDQVIDGAVSSGTACSSLGGTVSFSTSAATLSWTPNATVLGAYEFKITGTNAVGSATDIMIVDVRPAYVTTNLRGNWDAQFGELTKPGSGSLTSWSNLTTSNGFDGTNNNSTNAAWAGNGAYLTPYRLTYDGSGRTNFGSSVMASQSKMMFTGWVAPSSVSTGNATIVGNSANATGNGFTVRQSKSQSGKMELVVGKSYQDLVLSYSPIAYWRLGETSGTTVSDISDSLNTGTLLNSPSLAQTGALSNDSDKAISLNGTSQRINLSSTIVAGTDMTYSAWVYHVAGDGAVLGTSGGDTSYVFLVYSSGSSLYVGSNTSVQQVFWPWNPAFDSSWKFLTLVKKGTTLELFYDGVSQGTKTLSNVSPIDIIGSGQTTGRLFNGKLDDIAIFNQALLSTQISNLYNAGLGTYGAACSSTSTFTNSIWNFIGGIFDGSTAKLFVNGRQECSVSVGADVSTGFSNPAGDLVVASSSSSSQANAWSGSLSDLKIYGTSNGSSVGTADDITTNFNATANRYRAVARPSENIVTSGMVLGLDAASGLRGYEFAGSGCSVTSWLDSSSTGSSSAFNNITSCGAASGWNGTGTTTDPYVLSLDGTDDYVSIPYVSAIDLTTAWSIESWILLRACPAGLSQILTDEYGAGSVVQYKLGFEGNCKPNVGFYSGGWHTSESSTAISTNTWYHLVGTYSGAAGEVRLYINGTLSATTTGLASSIANSAARKLIGKRWDNGDYLNANIAKIALYSRALSASEVSQNCNALKARFSLMACN
jgi:Concanavalin A-like lectin/glucanases superfamily